MSALGLPTVPSDVSREVDASLRKSIERMATDTGGRGPEVDEAIRRTAALANRHTADELLQGARTGELPGKGRQPAGSLPSSTPRCHRPRTTASTGHGPRSRADSDHLERYVDSAFLIIYWY